MIRFINLKDQINEGSNEFAFFDTVIDQFVKINSEMSWESKEDFIDTFNLEAFPERHSEMECYVNLIPKDWNETKALDDKINTLFSKYSNLMQFEEGSPEYLIDKEDFMLAIKEFVK